MTGKKNTSFCLSTVAITIIRTLLLWHLVWQAMLVAFCTNTHEVLLFAGDLHMTNVCTLNWKLWWHWESGGHLEYYLYSWRHEDTKGTIFNVIIYYIAYIPYKMKYWREYYLAKHTEKHFGKINIGDQNKIISYMHIKLQLGANFSMRVLVLWHRYGSIRCQELHSWTPCIKGFVPISALSLGEYSL